MPLIDDEGNLFGIVNVVDALVVVVLIIIIVAGIALVSGIDEGGDDSALETETRYATIDLGQQPVHVIDQLEAGDVGTIHDSDETMTVTDVHVSPAVQNHTSNTNLPTEADDTFPHATIRIEVEGEPLEEGADPIQVSDWPFRPGTGEWEFDIGGSVLKGEIVAIDEEGPSLPVEETQVLLEGNVSESTATEIDEGDSMQIGSHSVATITSVQITPTNRSDHRAHVGVELLTLDRDGEPTFGGQTVTLDRQLQLAMGSYDLDGKVAERSNGPVEREENTTIAEVTLENVSPHVADTLEEGVSETYRDETLATVTAVERESAEVVVESTDGNVYLREHPQYEDVTLTVELRTHERENGTHFRGERLVVGKHIFLDFDTVFVEGEITETE
ncbi:DUF4330 family protein [Natrarchaeobius sp. A-rgal3]|uniref:DUF4330 family protein n=1 Tax=Natrarchaeobius versutus TaxID=1679078 RepID=UPI00350FA54A